MTYTKNTGRSYIQSCSPKGFTCPSSSRKISMRDIGAANTLYPAHQHCGVTARVGRGFTLIELLVVVLIIGILAAVAVPQYQKAVIKARARQGIVIIQSMWQAQQLYILANGTRAENLNDLDVTIPAGYKEWSFLLDGNTIQARNWTLTKTGAHQSARYTLLMFASSRSPQIFCKSVETNICEILSGGEIGNPPGYGGTWYIVQ